MAGKSTAGLCSQRRMEGEKRASKCLRKKVDWGELLDEAWGRDAAKCDTEGSVQLPRATTRHDGGRVETRRVLASPRERLLSPRSLLNSPSSRYSEQSRERDESEPPLYSPSLFSQLSTPKADRDEREETNRPSSPAVITKTASVFSEQRQLNCCNGEEMTALLAVEGYGGRGEEGGGERGRGEEGGGERGRGDWEIGERGRGVVGFRHCAVALTRCLTPVGYKLPVDHPPSVSSASQNTTEQRRRRRRRTCQHQTSPLPSEVAGKTVKCVSPEVCDSGLNKCLIGSVSGEGESESGSLIAACLSSGRSLPDAKSWEDKREQHTPADLGMSPALFSQSSTPGRHEEADANELTSTDTAIVATSEESGAGGGRETVNGGQDIESPLSSSCASAACSKRRCTYTCTCTCSWSTDSSPAEVTGERKDLTSCQGGQNKRESVKSSETSVSPSLSISESDITVTSPSSTSSCSSQDCKPLQRLPLVNHNAQSKITRFLLSTEACTGQTATLTPTTNSNKRTPVDAECVSRDSTPSVHPQIMTESNAPRKLFPIHRIHTEPQEREKENRYTGIHMLRLSTPVYQGRDVICLV